MAECLRAAIEEDLDGFYAGTTKADRRVMANRFHIKPKPLAEVMPEEPKKRRVFRKIVTEVQDTLTYLDGLEPPTELSEYGLAM